VGASLADLGAGIMYARTADPKQTAQTGLPAEAFSSQLGDRLRDMGRTLRPDAEASGMAESVLYQFARGGVKVVAGALAAGPVGVLAAGAEEGMTQSDELRRQGVDVATRTNAGVVAGAGLAVAALPVAGQTFRSTAALYVAGGPGAYVAQQAMTREILQRGGYQKLADQSDPLDPVGLAVSALVPVPFAAVGLRANRRAAAAAADAQFAAGPVPSARTAVAQAVDEVAVPREVVDAAMVAHQGERLRAVDDAAALMLRQAAEPQGVESLAAFVARNGFKEPPAPPKAPAGPDPFLAWVRAQGGIDIGEKLDITGEANAIRGNPGGIFRKAGISSDDLATRAAAEGWLLPGQEADTGALVDLVKRAVAGEKVLTIEGQAEKAARDLAEAQNAARLADLEDRLRLLGEDPAAARGNADAIDAYLAQNEPRLLRAALDEIAAARVLDEDSPGMLAMRERAAGIARDVQDGGRTVDEYAAEVEPLSPAMRRMVQEVVDRDAARATTAPNAARAAAPRGAGEADAPAGAADAGRPAAQVEARGLTDGAKAEAQAAATRVEQLRAEFPDLMVQMDGMDAPMKLGDFLAAAKAEADEMLADAPLMQVAAECALVNGY
jgi:hypothetical protein